MRKILLFISLFIFFIIPVKADTTRDILVSDYTPTWGGCNTSSSGYYYNNFNSFISDSENRIIFNNLYDNITNIYNSSYSNYYYQTSVNIFSESNSILNLYGVVIIRQISLYSTHFTQAVYNDNLYIVSYYENGTYVNPLVVNRNGLLNLFDNQKSNTESQISYSCSNTQHKYVLGDIDYYNPFSSNSFNPTFLFDSNLPVENENKTADDTTINLKDSNNNIIETFLPSSPYPILFSNGYEDTTTFTEVNLDNYDYVLLSLKNYNQSDSFQTNLQVKGQIGITPIYNYGQTSKDSITGSQVQDRCNVNYDSYTTYPFYILQSDLQNNAIFAVKECESGSSFKFDSSIFDITYITSQNADNPTITIGGNSYDVIPYDDLPSTATKNEEDNYIPGQSGSAVDTGGLDSAIKGVQQALSTLWNTFTYFTDFVGLIFSSLPVELRTILLSAFVVAITIGLIKLFTN